MRLGKIQTTKYNSKIDNKWAISRAKKQTKIEHIEFGSDDYLALADQRIEQFLKLQIDSKNGTYQDIAEAYNYLVYILKTIKSKSKLKQVHVFSHKDIGLDKLAWALRDIYKHYNKTVPFDTLMEITDK
jgi:hypothetical protein